MGGAKFTWVEGKSNCYMCSSCLETWEVPRCTDDYEIEMKAIPGKFKCGLLRRIKECLFCGTPFTSIIPVASVWEAKQCAETYRKKKLKELT